MKNRDIQDRLICVGQLQVKFFPPLKSYEGGCNGKKKCVLNIVLYMNKNLLGAFNIVKYANTYLRGSCGLVLLV